VQKNRPKEDKLGLPLSVGSFRRKMEEDRKDAAHMIETSRQMRKWARAVRKELRGAPHAHFPHLGLKDDA